MNRPPVFPRMAISMAILMVGILLPLLSVFSKALATPIDSLRVILQSENLEMIGNSLPASLMEAARISGASLPCRIRRMFLPLLSSPYAIGALLVFVKTLSEYGTPSTLGRRIGFEVFTTKIHHYATIAPIRFGAAAALSTLLVAICLLLWLRQNTITRKRSWDLSAARKRLCVSLSPMETMLAWTFVLLVLFLSIGIPYFSVTATALIKLRGYGLRRGNYTLQNFIDLFEIGGKGLRAMGTSMFLAISAATIDAVVGTAVAMVAHKDHGHGTRQLTALALLPEMLPNIVLVIGLMLFWNQLAKIIPLYNTLGIMVLSYSVLFLPYSVQYVQSALALMGSHLEEAGLVSGGNPSYVFLHVTLPLLKGPIATGWMMTCIISLRELVCASLIAPPNKLVVSTFIMREFEQGSVSTGMAMAFLCTVVTTIALLVLNRLMGRERL